MSKASKTTKTKTLSFIMPVYNAEKFLRPVVEKILAIDIPGIKIELIAVNDCSPLFPPKLIAAFHMLVILD